MDYSNFSNYRYSGGYFGQNPPAPPPVANQAADQYLYGWPVTPGMPNMHQQSGQWVQPPQGGGGRGSFPRKARGAFGSGRPGFGAAARGFKRPLPKPFDPTGKTPAMLVHELFKDIIERYEEVSLQAQTKRYKCVLTVDGREFSNEAASKKIAKQKASELVLRGLRPDVPITPFEDPVAATPPKKKAQDEGFTLTSSPGLAPQPPIMQPKKNGPSSSKKAKVQVPAVDSALSFIDAVRKLCQEREASGPYNPQFEFEEVTAEEINNKMKKRFICILSFPEKNIKFTAEAIGRTAPKDMVCYKALKEVFGVTDQQIRAITRRNVLGKGGQMPVVQTLHHVATLCHCTVVFKIEPVESGMGIGTGKQMTFVCELTLTDHTQGDKVVVVKSSPFQSKHEAKEDSCRKILWEHFEIDPASATDNSSAAPPCQKLQVLCAKHYKKNNVLQFEDLGTVGVKDHSSFGFRFKCIIEGREFYGTGSSKKDAKNGAASEALKAFCGIEEEAEPPTPPSAECHDLTGFALADHQKMMAHFGVTEYPPTRFAAFLFVNAGNCKRTVSLAAIEEPTVISGEHVVGSEGAVLHQVDSIVLARRALVRYLMENIATFNPDSPKNVLEQLPSGKFKLRDDMRLMMYTTFVPSLEHCKETAAHFNLPVYGSDSLQRVPGDDPMSMEEIMVKKNMKSHSPVDKIFKWTHLGVQGALLSQIMEPMLLDRIYVASSHPVYTNADLSYAFFSRLGQPTRDVNTEFAMRPVSSSGPGAMKYVYVRGAEDELPAAFEMLGDGGKQVSGEPSAICKRSLYKLFQQIHPAIPRDMPYESAKALATEYHSSKQMMYTQLEVNGYGKWHTKPTELSNFTLNEEEQKFKTEDSSTVDFSLDT